MIQIAVVAIVSLLSGSLGWVGKTYIADDRERAERRREATLTALTAVSGLLVGLMMEVRKARSEHVEAQLYQNSPDPEDHAYSAPELPIQAAIETLGEHLVVLPAKSSVELLHVLLDLHEKLHEWSIDKQIHNQHEGTARSAGFKEGLETLEHADEQLRQLISVVREDFDNAASELLIPPVLAPLLPSRFSPTTRRMIASQPATDGRSASSS